MSDFNELIKSFPKTREYVRDFYVYGFKNREDFKSKSPRTYDNERRRLESWLAPFVRKNYATNGSNISLAIDSNLLDTNPLFQVWKTKSFTDNDITLHFIILDILADREKLSAEEITDRISSDYDLVYDTQTVRRKCNSYDKEGILAKEKSGKKVVYYIDTLSFEWLINNSEIFDALFFFQLAEAFGEVGHFITEQFDNSNEVFRVKHSFSVHTLEDEILLSIIEAIKNKKQIKIELKSTKSDNITYQKGVPLEIFVSARTGRRFICLYQLENMRFSCYRLDSIKSIDVLDNATDYDVIKNKLDKNKEHLWGVSFQNDNNRRLDKLSVTIKIDERYEKFILTRLKKEGRGGTIEKIQDGLYKYEKEVFDCNEMIPWLRTFIGRIVDIQCTSPSFKRRFYRDLKAMFAMYNIETASEHNIPLPIENGDVSHE